MQLKQMSLVISLALTWGCAAGIEVTRRDEAGGVIKYWGPVVAGHRQARLAMAMHCGGRFQVEGERDEAATAAHEISYRCERPINVRRRNTMAFLRGGFER